METANEQVKHDTAWRDCKDKTLRLTCKQGGLHRACWTQCRSSPIVYCATLLGHNGNSVNEKLITRDFSSYSFFSTIHLSSPNILWTSDAWLWKLAALQYVAECWESGLGTPIWLMRWTWGDRTGNTGDKAGVTILKKGPIDFVASLQIRWLRIFSSAVPVSATVQRDKTGTILSQVHVHLWIVMTQVSGNRNRGELKVAQPRPNSNISLAPTT